ncbi:PREDICTED: uncharacterized protein LOC106740793 [Dinoponera quadriceps]|uniref:Uncharacterized protein LOC106740793 n=1 Tax=Dinoponera quadriceps TaxID=609295 RepID=A0A6P3WNP6_DINQU|nr:PREDICTED: uncharacterized protein LOC106740793 [Dinoponera quadriceps]
MENITEVNVVSGRETSLQREEQFDFPQIRVKQQGNKYQLLRFNPVDQTSVDKTIVKSEISACNSTIESIANNIDRYLDHKELKNEPSQICEDKIIRHEGPNVSAKDNEEKPIPYIVEKATKVNRRVSTRKTKKDNQLAEDKKESLKKANPAKVVKRRATSRRTTKASSKLLDVTKLLKQGDKELVGNCSKVGLYKVNSAGCFKCTLPPFVRPETKVCDVKFSNPDVARQQESSQYDPENNADVLQHLNYNNLKYRNHQQVIPVVNSWMTALKGDENFVLNNSINNAQTEAGQCGYRATTNDKQHHAYTTVADYSWKQNENPHYNSFVNSTDHSYKLLAENKVHYPCGTVYRPSCLWNNMYMENFPWTNAAFQQAAGNVAPGYVLPVNSSGNFLNPAAMPFNHFHCYQPLLMDENLKKLYYSSLNSNEFPVRKENTTTPLFDNWHQPSVSMIPSNSSSSIPTAAWYNAASPSVSLDASTSAISNAGKAELKQQSAYFGINHYNADTTKASVYKDHFSPYARPALENALPAIDTHGLDLYKTDDGLTTGTFVQQNSTAINTDNGIMSDMANPTSETNSVNPPEELRTSCMYTKDKKLISKVLESIL